MNRRLINLDANASYGLLPEVEEALRSKFYFLNPSSIHQGGQTARALIEESRDKITNLLGLQKGERIVLTSGATEANNSVVLFAYLTQQKMNLEEQVLQYQPLCLCNAMEHASVIDPVKRLLQLGWDVKFVNPNTKNQQLTAREFESNANENLRFVSTSLVNNETGQIFPVAEIFLSLKKYSQKPILHCDAVQALGKFNFNFSDLGADLLTISGHKIGALSGTGAIVVARDFIYEPVICGGSQERYLRGGTENVVGIYSFGIAAEVIKKNLDLRMQNFKRKRQLFLEALREHISDVVINSPENSVNNTINIRIPRVSTQELLVALDLQGILVSAGAACSAGKPTASHVLQALGLSIEESLESLRISFRADVAEEDLLFAARKIAECAQRIRGELGNKPKQSNICYSPDFT